MIGTMTILKVGIMRIRQFNDVRRRRHRCGRIDMMATHACGNKLMPPWLSLI